MQSTVALARPRVPREILLAALAVVAFLALHAVLHLDVGGWIAKGAARDTVVVEGHLVEWEWLHVGATARLLAPETTTFEAISSQDAFRFVPGLLVAAFAGPMNGIYGGALLVTLVTWLAASAVTGAVAHRAWRDRPRGSPHFAAIVGAGIVSQGAGYIAFVGNVDAHQIGYAAVALWCGAWVLFRPDEPAPDRRNAVYRAASVGLCLCVAGYVMEIAYPLLLSSWLLLGAAAWRRALRPPDALRRALVLTAAFALPYLAFQAVVRVTLGDGLVPLNDPLQQLAVRMEALHADGPVTWVSALLYNLALRWPAAFPLPVTALALVGLFVTPRRWLIWALLVLLPLLGAVSVTKLIVRTLYLVHPPVYLLAACGAAWLAERAGGALPRLRYVTPAILVLSVGAVFVATNADLWGDYFIPTWWWRIQ